MNSFRIRRWTLWVDRALVAFACALPLQLAAQAITFLGDRDLAPYEFLVNGVPRGANVDLANAIGRVLGRKVEIELLDWSEAQARVKAGRGDVLTMLGRTDEREADYSFTQETLPVAFALFVRSNEKRELGDTALPEALGRRRIGVTQGGLARTLLERAYPDATFVVVDNLLDGTRRLRAAEIDAFGAQVWSETFLLSELGVRGITSLPPFAERHGNIAVRKGNEALRAELDRALSQLKATGEFDAIIGHWSSTRLQLVSESTVIGLAVAGGVAVAAVVLLSAGLLWSRRQKAALSREVQERRKAEQALLESQSALQAADSSKDRFIATLAHELRNPLAPISNAVQVLEMKGGGESDEARWAREVIGRQTAHLTRLIDDLLDVGRITSGKLELRRAPCLLSDVIRDAAEVSEPLISGLQHRLEVRQPAEPVWLNVDKARLVQVVMNLLTNAAKYTPGRGVIHLQAELDGNDFVLRVRDQGIGISPDQLHDIFAMFHQESRSLAHAAGGLGIGLWITRRLVQMHGGTIEASSDGAGQGATFTVRLPAARCDAPAARAVAPEGAVPPSALSSVRALVVDDNIDSAESTSLLLAMFGCEVETAYDGAQALDAAARSRFRLVLLDLAMPKLSGHEVCRRLRGLDWGREALIVAMTGWGGENDKRATHEAGFDGHLVKPIDTEALRTLLQRCR